MVYTARVYGANFFVTKKRVAMILKKWRAKTFLDAKKGGGAFYCRKKGDGKFFHRSKILKTRPGSVNSGRSLMRGLRGRGTFQKAG